MEKKYDNEKKLQEYLAASAPNASNRKTSILATVFGMEESRVRAIMNGREDNENVRT